MPSEETKKTVFFAAAPSVSMMWTVADIDTALTFPVGRGPEPIEDIIDIEDRSYKYVIDD